MDEEHFFREVDLAADRVIGGSTMLDDFKIAFRDAQRCHYPDLTEEEWHRLFERWFVHYRDKLMAKEDEADARAMKLWEERRSLMLERSSCHRDQSAPGRRRAALAADRSRDRGLVSNRPTVSTGCEVGFRIEGEFFQKTRFSGSLKTPRRALRRRKLLRAARRAG